jgi:hypothetical protein
MNIENKLHKFYQENGFIIFKSVFSDLNELNLLHEEYKSHDNIIENNISKSNILDLANKFKSAMSLACDERLLNSLMSCTGIQNLKFLKWSLFQINHMSFPWHRDGPNRNFGIGGDWTKNKESYNIAKVLIYLKCKDFALCVQPGSHNKNISISSIKRERKFHQNLYNLDDNINKINHDAPCLIHVKPGDIIIFNQRLLHCGRLLDTQNKELFSEDIKDEKSFLTFLYGEENSHSHRMYSYFEYERKFNTSLYNTENKEILEKENLLPLFNETNYFDKNNDERKDIFLV